ncbi:MAG: prepilin-type N-terminal cleavage/methylation domain-containing protein [Cardiobacteriaceae bacterium]|nr:prepilin-type N-terminal cleavage/methylation domain-containing protein [Cardiobacteriaceae bacterium]
MKRFSESTRLQAQRGLTLLELIVSLTIGLFLLLAMALTYNIGFKVSQQVSDIANLHANAKAVFDRVGRDLASAGYVDLMDRPHTPFKDTSGNVCLKFDTTTNPNQTYASFTLNFGTDLVPKIYSRAVDNNTDAKILRNQLSTIGFVSCGNMQPIVGCDRDSRRTSPTYNSGAFALDKPSTSALLGASGQVCNNSYNPTTDRNRDSQLQIAFQAQSVGNTALASLRSGATHQADQTGINSMDTAVGTQPLDCAGNPIQEADNGFVVNRYYLEDNQLVCKGNGGAANADAVAIASNIHEFKVRYRLGAHEEDAKKLGETRTSAIVIDTKIASELNNAVNPVSNGYSNIDSTEMSWSRVVGAEICIIVSGSPTDGIIPSNLQESQAFIPTCQRDANNRELYAAGTPRAADDKKYYLRLTKTFSIPNSLFQFEVNRS